jgi:predicted ATP-grasp superfamily ATP-dependent carboligase
MNFNSPAPIVASGACGGLQRGALILDGAHGSLAVARSLGRQGIPVWFVASEQLIPRFSRYVARTLFWPGAEQPGAFDALMEIGRRHHLDGWVLFPGGDAEARLVSHHHDELSSFFRVVTPPWDVMRWAADKRLTNEHAESLGIDFPWSHYPKGRQDLEQLQCRFPLILKPTVRKGRNALIQAKAWRVNDRASLLARYDQAVRLVGEQAIVLQELIPGSGATQFSYAALMDQGEPVASLVARRSRQYPIDFGYTSTLVQTIENKEVEEAACRFLSSLRYSGLVEIEFKYDARDNRYKILDVNARTWTWIGLGAIAGVDFPHLQWRLALGEKLPRLRGNPGAAWMHSSRDFVAAFQEMWMGTIAPDAYRKSLRGPLVFAAFAVDDPVPGLVDLPLALSHLVTRRLPVMAQGALHWGSRRAQ